MSAIAVFWSLWHWYGCPGLLESNETQSVFFPKLVIDQWLMDTTLQLSYHSRIKACSEKHHGLFQNFTCLFTCWYGNKCTCNLNTLLLNVNKWHQSQQTTWCCRTWQLNANGWTLTAECSIQLSNVSSTWRNREISVWMMFSINMLYRLCPAW